MAPTSLALSKMLTWVVPQTGDPTVVQLGAGTAELRRAVAERLAGRGRHLAVEADPLLAERPRRTRFDVNVGRGDLTDLDTDLDQVLSNATAGPVDAVINGLPWRPANEERLRLILGQVCRSLTVNGGFSAFAWRHSQPLSGRRFRRLLGEYFDEVVVTPTVWTNRPPAYAYVCHRPLSDSRNG